MKKNSKKTVPINNRTTTKSYDAILSEVVDLLESARRTSVRTINTIMTATYWEIGRRIVEYEQGGIGKADYGKKLIDHLAIDLTKKFGRGFGRSNLFQMRSFYLAYSTIVQTPSGQLNSNNPSQIFQTSSGVSMSMSHNQISQTVSGESKYEFAGKPYLQTLSEKSQIVSAKSYLAELATRLQHLTGSGLQPEPFISIFPEHFEFKNTISYFGCANSKDSIYKIEPARERMQ
ncbi:MAG: DUF1016 family protein [Candidatus Jettenia sp.]|uniref:YhcG N-terminal domain-containing protein n=1 Tax=Candidatus Jettenia caeni TaxID=247490 RepID=I3IKM1_9BACT|nr:DUF1016 N-terminal domain-containing protein [Candidatus Jettenia sp. AMX1]MBC6929430.1 DUF1016 family protein [Candidatus Jettenia sp.]NUN22268.1 DUF1016 family protein [Candidatus Jettenia caeni]KAA0247583.1 MAG: DUF1016 family protein [Candidatus Jettenia sp. AMX1]MCE7880831.1 DUF1016 family protein [Candidatus Jettenia sp. AMX1]MCQ3927615.1 DUF1016 family protein [Candidatus Jettenia sp.]